MAVTDIGGTPMIQTGTGYGEGFGSNWVWAFILLALLGGGGLWGNRGYGMGEAALSRELLSSELSNSQAMQDIQAQIRGITYGISDATFALNNSIKDGFYATQSAIGAVNTNLGNAICSSTYELANRVNGVGTQLQNCCCQIERGQLETNYLNERNTNAIIQNASSNTQRILDYLNCKELADKNQQIFDMSQKAQTAEIIAAMKPVAPVPAYIQPSPYAAYGYQAGCNGFGV